MDMPAVESDGSGGVLIVDDDPDIRLYLKTLTESVISPPNTASTGKEALRLFRDTRPGVVVLDYMLPDMTGEEVLREITEVSPLTQVIIITGYGKYDLAVRLLNGGACDYLKKPLEKELIIGSLKKAYSNYRSLIKSGEKINIIVADEDEKTYKTIKEKLGENGWSLCHATDIPGAQALFTENPAEIVILNAVFCGEGHGYECMENLKKLPFSTEVIIIAEKGTEMKAAEALRRGAVSFLRKPEDIEQIANIIKRTLNSLNLKRLFKLKMHEFSESRDIVARVTDSRNIQLSMFTANSTISSSFALRLLDNIPIGVAIFEPDLSIS